MSSVFHDMNFQKTDLNTIRELKEDCWRKARDEEFFRKLAEGSEPIYNALEGAGRLQCVCLGDDR